jgi:hypothetical protein
MRLGEGWEVHVVPVEDRRRHEPDMGCWCGPRIEDGDIVVHASADRREFGERPRPALRAGLRDWAKCIWAILTTPLWAIEANQPPPRPSFEEWCRLETLRESLRVRNG